MTCHYEEIKWLLGRKMKSHLDDKAKFHAFLARYLIGTNMGHRGKRVPSDMFACRAKRGMGNSLAVA